MPELDSIDHIAIAVEDVPAALDWYKRRFHCEVTYQDDTWAFLQFGNVRLALVITSQHPAHIAFVSREAEKSGALKLHRDGTRSCYVTDPAGNSVEIIAADPVDDQETRLAAACPNEPA
jgi:catechol 2,3-dioxygenase-like lactoylglutathione lyase family enzyme